MFASCYREQTVFCPRVAQRSLLRIKYDELNREKLSPRTVAVRLAATLASHPACAFVGCAEASAIPCAPRFGRRHEHGQEKRLAGPS